MRIAVVGSSSTGGYFGGLLARDGEIDPHRPRGPPGGVARARPHGGVEARRNVHGTRAGHGRAWQDGSVDLILFCVKTYDTDRAAESIRP